MKTFFHRNPGKSLIEKRKFDILYLEFPTMFVMEWVAIEPTPHCGKS